MALVVLIQVTANSTVSIHAELRNNLFVSGGIQGFKGFGQGFKGFGGGGTPKNIWFQRRRKKTFGV